MKRYEKQDWKYKYKFSFYIGTPNRIWAAKPRSINVDAVVFSLAVSSTGTDLDLEIELSPSS